MGEGVGVGEAVRVGVGDGVGVLVGRDVGFVVGFGVLVVVGRGVDVIVGVVVGGNVVSKTDGDATTLGVLVTWSTDSVGVGDTDVFKVELIKNNSDLPVTLLIPINRHISAIAAITKDFQ